MQNPKWIVIITGAGLLALCIVAGGWYLYSSSSRAVEQARLEQNHQKLRSSIDEARVLLTQGKREEARSLFEAVNKSALSPADQAAFDVAIAGITFNGNKDEGARLYAAVARNVSYPEKNRAYATIEFAAQYISQSNSNLADPFFSEQELAQHSSLHERYIALCEKSYSLYPFSFAAAEIAKSKISNLVRQKYANPLASGNQNLGKEALAIVAPYMAIIDERLPDVMPPNKSDFMLSPTLLAKATLLNNLEYLEAPLPSSPKDSFKEAIQRAQDLDLTGQEQFARFFYAAYLARVGTADQVRSELEALVARILNNPLRTRIDYLDTPNLLESQFPSLKKMADRDVAVRELLKQLGLNF